MYTHMYRLFADSPVKKPVSRDASRDISPRDTKAKCTSHDAVHMLWTCMHHNDMMLYICDGHVCRCTWMDMYAHASCTCLFQLPNVIRSIWQIVMMMTIRCANQHRRLHHDLLGLQHPPVHRYVEHESMWHVFDAASARVRVARVSLSACFRMPMCHPMCDVSSLSLPPPPLHPPHHHIISCMLPSSNTFTSA